MIQIYHDFNKNFVLTQFSTIQRMNQRLIICMIVILQNEDIKFYLRNIIQTYMQSISNLNRDFFIKFSIELINLLNVSFDYVFQIMKSLYDVFEIDNH